MRRPSENKFMWRSLLWIMVLGVGAFAASGCKKKKQVAEVKPLPLHVMKVGRGDIEERLTFSGDVKGEVEVKVYSTVPDRIKKLYVDAGDVVKKGQLLAVIEHTRLYQAVEQSRAQLASTRSQLSGARVSLSAARIGAASAAREYKRLRRLLKNGAVGGQQVDNARSQYLSSQTNVRAAAAQIKTLQAQIRSIRAAVGQARTARGNAIIRAPISGIVSRRFFEQGDMVSAQMPLMTIVRMDVVKVELHVTERDMPKVRVGKAATVTVVGQPGRRFQGRVTKVLPTLDQDTRTVPVTLEIPNVHVQPSSPSCRKDSDCSGRYNRCIKQKRRRACAEVHPVKPGMIATVNILVENHKDAILLPVQALRNDSFSRKDNRSGRQQLEVLVVTPAKKIETRLLTLGVEDDKGYIQVLAGLKAGETVVVKGQNLYKEGVPFQITRIETLKAPVRRPRPHVLDKKTSRRGGVKPVSTAL